MYSHTVNSSQIMLHSKYHPAATTLPDTLPVSDTYCGLSVLLLIVAFVVLAAISGAKSGDEMTVPLVEGVEFATLAAIIEAKPGAKLGAGPLAGRSLACACSAVKIARDEFLLL